MKALILAAGVGSRLQDKTKDLPKCLVPVNGKPMLEHQLNALAQNGITDVVMVLGHKAEKIREFTTNLTKFNFTFLENPDYGTTNSSYSWWLARDEIQNEQYLQFHSDIVFDPRLLTKLIENPHENVLLVDKNVELDASMEQVVLEGDRIIFMNKANLPNAVGRGSGMVKLSPNAVSLMLAKLAGHIDSGDRNQHFHGLMRYALQQVPFHVLDPEGSSFKEVNTPEELQVAEEAIREWKKY